MLPSVLPKSNIVGYSMNPFCHSQKSEAKKTRKPLNSLASEIANDIITSRRRRPRNPIVFVGHGYDSVVVDRILFANGQNGQAKKDEQNLLASSTAAIFLFRAPLEGHSRLQEWLKNLMSKFYTKSFFQWLELQPTDRVWRGHIEDAIKEDISIFAFTETGALVKNESSKTEPAGHRAGRNELDQKEVDRKKADQEMLDQMEALKLATVKATFSDVATVGRIAGPETTQFRDVHKFMSSAITFHQLLENSMGQTLLHIREKQCYHEAMSQLLKLGAIDVDHQNKLGNTAPHGVLNKSSPYSISMARDLLYSGANPTVKNGKRESPLDISRKPGQGNKQMNPMLMEELLVVGGIAEKDGRQSLGGGTAPIDEDAINACRETIMVLRNIFCGKEWITARHSYSAL